MCKYVDVVANAVSLEEEETKPYFMVCLSKDSTYKNGLCIL